MTPEIAFLSHASYCYDHRHDDDEDEFGFRHGDPVLLPFALKDGAGEYAGKVFAVQINESEIGKSAIIVYVPRSGTFRWELDQLELPPLPTPEEIRDLVNRDYPDVTSGWRIEFINRDKRWASAWVERGGINPGTFDHDAVTLVDPQGDLEDYHDDPMNDLYGEFVGQEPLRIPYANIVSVTREAWPTMARAMTEEERELDAAEQSVSQGFIDLVARGRALIASALSGTPQTPDLDEALEAIAAVRSLQEAEEDALEAEFVIRLDASTDWELFDSGSVPDTGLRCLHCGYEERFADREVAIAVLSGSIACSNCGGTGDGWGTDPDDEPLYDPVAPAVITRMTERGALFSTFPLTYENVPLLEMTVTNANKMSTAALLLDISDAAVLYHALDAWLYENAPEFTSSLDPMGDAMGDNR